MSQTLSLQGVTMMPPVGPFRPAVFDTTGGLVEARWYEAKGSTVAVLWLGDAEGGFDSPANGLYDRLAEAYLAKGACSLRVQYRNPGDPGEIGLDALVAAFVLSQMEIARIVAVGWGLGAVGAVQIAHTFPTVAAVALQAPRALAPGATAGLGRPMLLQHGTSDAVAPTQLSRDLLAAADEPKRIAYYHEAGHRLDEAAAAVEADLVAWLDRQLGVGDVQGLREV